MAEFLKANSAIDDKSFCAAQKKKRIRREIHWYPYASRLFPGRDI
jgi:hypothetical protein